MSSGFVTEAEGDRNYSLRMNSNCLLKPIFRWRRKRSKGKMNGKEFENLRILLM